MLLRVRYSYHWIFKRKIHFLSCSGKHVYSSCTDAGWFRLTCHTCCRQQQEKPLSLIIHIFNKVKKTALSKLTFSTAKSWAKYKYLRQDKELITWACKQEYLLENAHSKNKKTLLSSTQSNQPVSPWKGRHLSPPYAPNSQDYRGEAPIATAIYFGDPSLHLKTSQIAGKAFLSVTLHRKCHIKPKIAKESYKIAYSTSYSEESCYEERTTSPFSRK